MLRKVEEQPADTDNYVRTSYGVAAVRCHHKPVSRRTIMALAVPRPPPTWRGVEIRKKLLLSRVCTVSNTLDSKTSKGTWMAATSLCMEQVRINERRATDADAALFGGPSPDPVTYQKGSGKTARLFSTSALSREPANCCMDDGFQR